MTPARQTGFTLIELMVTVAIIGIITAIALPNYSEYVRRGTLPEAFSRLANTRIQLEQFYQNNRNYGTGTCGNDGTADRVSLTAEANNFALTCALAGGGQGYTLTATGSTGRSSGHVYTLDSNNVKATTSFKGAAVTRNCWLDKGGEC